MEPVCERRPVLGTSLVVKGLRGFASSTSGKESNFQGRETQETKVWALGQEYPLEEEVATHSSILTWETARTEEPGGLQSAGLQGRTWLSH